MPVRRSIRHHYRRRGNPQIYITLPYEQIYAQAKYLIDRGFQYWFDLEDIETIEAHNDDFRAQENEEQLLAVYFDHPAADSLILNPDSTATDSVLPLYVYAWGSSEVFGSWPGKPLAEMDSIDVLGIELRYTQITGFVGDEFHLIINNNSGKQLPDYDIKAEEKTGELYLKIADTGITPLSVTPKVRRK